MTSKNESLRANRAEDQLEVSAIPDALILFNPALDLNLPGVEKNWGKEIADKIMGISPLQHVKGTLPPTIIFHGIADSTIGTVYQSRTEGTTRGNGRMCRDYCDKPQFEPERG